MKRFPHPWNPIEIMRTMEIDFRKRFNLNKMVDTGSGKGIFGNKFSIDHEIGKVKMILDDGFRIWGGAKSIKLLQANFSSK